MYLRAHHLTVLPAMLNLFLMLDNLVQSALHVIALTHGRPHHSMGNGIPSRWIMAKAGMFLVPPAIHLVIKHILVMDAMNTTKTISARSILKKVFLISKTVRNAMQMAVNTKAAMIS